MPDRIPIAPGVYRGVPFGTYCAWDAVNRGSLDDLLDFSPFHCRYWQEHPKEDTQALLVGRALHTRLLEPDQFDAEFAIIGQCEGVTGKGARCRNGGSVIIAGQSYCKTHVPEGGEPDPRTQIDAGELATVEAMAAAVRADEMARRFIYTRCSENELSIVWEDRETGLVCKARLDMPRPTWGCVGDLKTTACAARSDFEGSLGNFGYHRQAAFYLDGARACGLDLPHFGIVAVEKKSPHGVATYAIDSAAVDAGRLEIRRALRTYAQCKATGDWWGYSSGFEAIGLRAWQQREIQKQSDAA